MSDETIQLEPGQAIGGPAFRLTVIGGPHEGMTWTLAGDSTVVIGRESPSNIKLPDEKMLSRKHLRVDLNSHGARLTDLSSSNGTWVNGLRVVEATLMQDDAFGVGETQIRFERLGVSSGSSTQPAVSENTIARAVDLPATKAPVPKAFVPKAPVPKAPAASESIEQTRVGGRPRVPELAMTEPIAPGGSPMTDGIFSADSGAFPIDANSDGSSPESVGAYDLIRKIGSGGMATVYLAEHRRSRESFAIKMIRTDLPNAEKYVQLFVREAGLLTRLDHPRIVRATNWASKRAFRFW